MAAARSLGMTAPVLDFRARVDRGAFTLEAAIEAHSGDVVAVLGPNGAGKSTLLRAIAGFVSVASGRIGVDGRTVDAPAQRTFVPARDRNLGVVFHDGRLFPHLRVEDNVAFGSRARGVPRAAARTDAHGWLARLGVSEYARARPRELSGGQAQRVALARALACRPAALLLDEPLAALDVQTRADVQGELRAALRSFDGATLFVTHDPVEALVMADRIVVLEAGRIVQEGTPADITSRPVTPYVARLVGTNLYAGGSAGGVVTLDEGGLLAVPGAADGRLLVALRPSAITVHLDHPGPSSARNTWPATIRTVAALGDRVRLTVDGPPAAHVDVTALALAELGLSAGQQVWLAAKATDLVTYPEPMAR
jgi:molybdate transport system ATP-binding protein